MESIDGSLRLAAYFGADIPAFEALVMAISLPRLFDNILVVFQFLRHITRIPVVARVVKAEVKLHIVFVGQRAKHLDKVDRGHVAAFFQQIRRGVSKELTVAGANVYHRIDADRLHVTEVLIPFFYPPVLMWNIVRYFVEEGACNG